MERAGYLAHARTREFARRLGEARECVTEALRLCERPYVAYSAGKDSACVLWLAREACPQIPAYTMTRAETRCLHPDLDRVIGWWRECFPEATLTEVNAKDAGAYGTPEGKIRAVMAAATTGHDGCFLGLRAGESGARATSLKAHHAIHRFAASNQYTPGSYRICPLARWETRDVWALIALHGLPVLAEYAQTGPEGRTALSLTRAGLKKGELSLLRARDPEGYRRLMEQRPDLQGES